MADDLTPKTYFEEKIPERLKAHPDVAKSIGAVYQFEITGPNGGSWHVDLTGEGTVGTGASDKAKCTITCLDTDFINIVTKKTNAQMAFMSGKLKIKGDMGLAMKLQKVLG